MAQKMKKFTLCYEIGRPHNVLSRLSHIFKFCIITFDYIFSLQCSSIYSKFSLLCYFSLCEFYMNFSHFRATCSNIFIQALITCLLQTFNCGRNHQGILSRKFCFISLEIPNIYPKFVPKSTQFYSSEPKHQVLHQ